MRTITTISPQKHDRQRVNISLDGEFAFGLSALVAAWLKVGDGLSEDRINELIRLDMLEQGNQKALAYLSRRPRTNAEMRKYLEKIGMSEDVIDEMLTRFGDMQLLDDREFAVGWVESRKQFRPRSRLGLRYELRQHGVNDEIIQDVLENLDEGELANDVAARLARRFRGSSWQDFRTKICGRLCQQGFPYGIADQAVRRAWELEHGVDKFELSVEEDEELVV